jgi:6-phosphogluconolactonase
VSAGTGEPRIVVTDEAAVAELAADSLIRALVGAIDARGVAHWATTGGSTPARVYRAMLGPTRRDQVDWAAVHVWWGDDRFVPRDHPLSNVKALDEILVDQATGVPIPVGHLHPFRVAEAIGGGRDAAWCAAALADELALVGPSSPGGWPVFDLVFLGVGADGHLMSVFPGSDAFDAEAWAMAIPAPTHIEPHVERVTMHPSIITAARDVLVTVSGASKADILADIMGTVREPRRWPAQVARMERATWILDDEAAARLPR